MNARCWMGLAALGLMSLVPARAAAALDVEVWTDRGEDAVYMPDDVLEVSVRASEDAYLLIYEIDTEGFVRMLYPYRGGSGFVEGGRTYSVPPEHSGVELAVQEGPAGECYIVAIASRERFRPLPGYLRPYDMQAEQVGYEGNQGDEASEIRFVGDPLVAIERIGRSVVVSSDSPDAFATAFTTYFVHERVDEVWIPPGDPIPPLCPPPVIIIEPVAQDGVRYKTPPPPGYVPPPRNPAGRPRGSPGAIATQPGPAHKPSDRHEGSGGSSARKAPGASPGVAPPGIQPVTEVPHFEVPRAEAPRVTAPSAPAPAPAASAPAPAATPAPAAASAPAPAAAPAPPPAAAPAPAVRGGIAVPALGRGTSPKG